MTTFTFNPSNQPVRVETIGGEPWFVAKDVCDALSLTNITETLNRLDDDEKLTSVILNSGQGRQMWLVNESGLYNLIFQSRKPEAKAFRKWVTAEVLPTIRKTGRYELANTPSEGGSVGMRALPKGRVKPRDRSAALGDFYRELRMWTRSRDVDEVAEMASVKRKSVLDVLRGGTMSVEILELLVAYAKENRRERRLTDIVPARAVTEDSRRRLEQLRIEFMEEGGAL